MCPKLGPLTLPSGAKRHRESTSSSSSWWFWHKTAAFSTEQCTSSSLFSRFEVSWGGSNHSLKNYGFLCDTMFSSHVLMHTNHLAMKCIIIITQDCWIRNTAGVQGVFEESLVWSNILWPILHNQYFIYWGGLWGQTCCSVIDGKLQLKHASAKKSDMNKNKKH